MRQLIGALASLALAGALAGGLGGSPSAASIGAAATPSTAARTTGPAGGALAVIRRFTSTLSAAQRGVLGGPTGTGVRWGSLTTLQREAALTMLRTLVSAPAWAVFTEAMAADDALAAAGSGEGSAGYRFGYLEQAGGESAFLQFAGPQLALNVIVRGAAVLVEPELVGS